MNCFTHSLPHLDDAYFAVGCCIPDWLSAVDRKCRTREKHAVKFIDDPDPIIAMTARGVVQHHQDDDWFHRTPIFNELILEFAVELRELFGNERSMRPSFVGHVMVELFLDAYLNAQHPGKLERFYQQVAAVDGEKVQQTINLFATRPTDKLVAGIERFVRVRFLFDYATDDGVVFWINKVLTRVKLEPLGDRILEWMPQARQRVYENVSGLLPQYAIEV
jgi:hypothetical protein